MHLLDLPPEIRNIIWGYMVVAPYPIRILHKPLKPLKPSRTRWVLPPKEINKVMSSEFESYYRAGTSYLTSQAGGRITYLAVAFTCRQIYIEATELYYGLNTFYDSCVYIHPDVQVQFLRAIGQRNANLITSIALYQIALYGLHRWSPQKYKSMAISLEHLKVYLSVVPSQVAL